jgi:hypothetical protein
MPSEIYNVLIACIRGDAEDIHKRVQATGWNWMTLLATASEEGLLPLLNSCRAAFGNPSDEIVQFLGEVEASNFARNSMLADEVAHVALLLNRRGIEPVLLKGAAYLAVGIYANPATRYTGDVDMLIPETRLADAVAALTEDGYVADDDDPFGEFRHHYRPLARPGRPPIELHHCLGLGLCARLLSAGEVIAQSRPHNCDGAAVRVPCPEHLAIHLVMHSQLLHAYTERIWPPLRALGDLLALNRFYGEALDWRAIGERFRRHGEYSLFALHLKQVAISIGEPIVELQWTPAIEFGWTRRKVLRRFPLLRYLDPIYMFATLLGRRFLILQNLLKTRGGWKHLSNRIAEPHIYLRLWTDFVEGRGR